MSLCPRMRTLAAQADIHFSLYIVPFRGAAQSANQLLKGIHVFGGILEPSEKVEWLAKLPAVMQTSRYCWQILHANSDVPRLLLEDGSTLILCQVPPSCRLADRNERSAGRLRSKQHLLSGAQSLDFRSVCVARVARRAAQHPTTRGRSLAFGALEDFQSFGRWQFPTDDSGNPIDAPCPGRAGDKRNMKWQRHWMLTDIPQIPDETARFSPSPGSRAIGFSQMAHRRGSLWWLDDLVHRRSWVL